MRKFKSDSPQSLGDRHPEGGHFLSLPYELIFHIVLLSVDEEESVVIPPNEAAGRRDTRALKPTRSRLEEATLLAIHVQIHPSRFV